MSEQAVFDTLKYRIEVDAYGTRRYYNAAKQLHRTDGPAIEYADGSKSWYKNDQYHRTDGPAIDWTCGRKEWYQNHKRHRIDGPAIIFEDGHKLWYINGKKLTEAEFNQKVKDV